MGARYGEEAGAAAPGAALRRERRRSTASTVRLRPGRPRARLGAGRCWSTRGSASSSPATTSGGADPTCAPFEPRDLRRVRHRGDVRPAGVPPPARSDEIGRLLHSVRAVSRALPCWSASMRSARPAGDRAAARGRLRRADLPPRRADRAVRALRGARRGARRAAPRHRRQARTSCAGRSCWRRPRRSTTAGRGGCPIR